MRGSLTEYTRTPDVVTGVFEYYYGQLVNLANSMSRKKGGAECGEFYVAVLYESLRKSELGGNGYSSRNCKNYKTGEPLSIKTYFVGRLARVIIDDVRKKARYAKHEILVENSFAGYSCMDNYNFMEPEEMFKYFKVLYDLGVEERKRIRINPVLFIIWINKLVDKRYVVDTRILRRFFNVINEEESRRDAFDSIISWYTEEPKLVVGTAIKFLKKYGDKKSIARDNNIIFYLLDCKEFKFSEQIELAKEMKLLTRYKKLRKLYSDTTGGNVKTPSKLLLIIKLLMNRGFASDF